MLMPTVRPETALDEMIERMREERRDAIAVVEKTGVMGIFTATNALRALTDLLQREAAQSCISIALTAKRR